MDQPTLLRLYDQEQRIKIDYPGLRKDATPNLVRFVRPGPGMNFILYSRIADADLDGAIAAQVAELSRLGNPFSWKVFAHDPQTNLGERLAAHGFVADTFEPVMALDLRDCPPSLLGPIDADIRRISAPAELAAIAAIEQEVWGGSFAWLPARLAPHMAIPGYLSIYAVWSAGAPACAGWIYFHPGSQFACLFGGSTLPGQRGRGLYTALLARRAQEALARGYRYLIIEPSAMSQPIVTRHGFHVITQARDYEWRRPQSHAD